MSCTLPDVVHLRSQHLLHDMRRQLLLLLLLAHRNRLLRDILQLLVAKSRAATQRRRKARTTETQELILLRQIRPDSEFHPIHRVAPDVGQVLQSWRTPSQRRRRCAHSKTRILQLIEGLWGIPVLQKIAMQILRRDAEVAPAEVLRRFVWRAPTQVRKSRWKSLLWDPLRIEVADR